MDQGRIVSVMAISIGPERLRIAKSAGHASLMHWCRKSGRVGECGSKKRAADATEKARELHVRAGARSKTIEAGRWKSSNAPTPPQALNSCRAPLGRRADVRVARPMPAPSERLGTVHRLINSLYVNRLHPHAHRAIRKILLCLKNFQIGRLAVDQPPHLPFLCEKIATAEQLSVVMSDIGLKLTE